MDTECYTQLLNHINIMSNCSSPHHTHEHRYAPAPICYKAVNMKSCPEKCTVYLKDSPTYKKRVNSRNLTHLFLILAVQDIFLCH